MSESDQFYHSLTIESNRSVKLDTKDFETDFPQSSSTILKGYMQKHQRYTFPTWKLFISLITLKHRW